MASTFHVSICGGGIGGLMLALVMGKYGSQCPVEIFEAGPTITTVGAGISFYARTLNIMKELGMHDEIVKMAVSPPQVLKFRKSDQPDGFDWFAYKVTNGLVTFHRKDILNFLLGQIPASCKIHTSKRLKIYDVDAETGKISLYFSDGSTAITDVLVGADGIHSATRKTMYQTLASLSQDDDSKKRLLEFVNPVWTGNLVYRNLIPTEKLSKEFPGVEAPKDPTLFLGKDKVGTTQVEFFVIEKLQPTQHIVTFPISQGQVINVVIFIHNGDAFGTSFKGDWVMDVSEKEVLDQFEEWEVHARTLVKCVEKPSRWALHSMRPLPHYVNGNVVLLGDAAHAMEPHFGAGAGQAIEDAFVLGRLLTHKLTHRGNVSDALNIYEEVRLPFANNVVQRSRDMGRCYGLHRVSADGGPVLDQNGPEQLDHVRKAIEDGWKWQSEPTWVWGEAEKHWLTKCGISDGSL